MLTIYTIPKSFRGHVGVIQRNSIKSWMLLEPKPEIILFGDDDGVGSTAEEFGLKHVSRIEKNEYGTPLLDDIFNKAKMTAANDILCYVNTDIILLDEFTKAVKKVVDRMRRFLIVGKRHDLDIGEPLHFGTHWKNELRQRVAKEGKLNMYGVDYFVFPRGLWDKIPPFAVGRLGWDLWFIYKGLSLGVPVVDATNAVTVVHQNHDYAHFFTNGTRLWDSKEAIDNRALGNLMSHFFKIEDATHILTPLGPKRILGYEGLRRFLHRLPFLYPILRPITKPFGIIKRVCKKLDSCCHR